MVRCKKCKGLGKIPTYEKTYKFGGFDFSGPKFILCPRCYGKGSNTK